MDAFVLQNAIMTTLLTIMTVCSIIKNTNMLLMQLISNEELYSHSDQADVMVKQCTSTIKKRKVNFRLNNNKKTKKVGFVCWCVSVYATGLTQNVCHL